MLFILKKILLIVLSCILILLTYISILWIMSLNSIVDKEGMIYTDTNVSQNETIDK